MGDIAVDRVALGCVTGAVQIWCFSTGVLLGNCVPQVLESTRWTTVGHNSDILSLTRAPPTYDGIMSATTTLASGDSQGTACVWTDEGHPAVCVQTAFELRRLKLVSHAVVGLATAPGLLLCCLFEAVVGFETPGGYPVLLLSSRDVPLYPNLRTGRLLSIAVVADDDFSTTSGGFQVYGATVHGAILAWDAVPLPRDAEGRDFIQRQKLEAQKCSVLAAPYHAKARHELYERSALQGWQGSAARSRDTLCWVCQVDPQEAVVQWTELRRSGNEKPMVLEGSVRKNLEGWLCIAPRG